MPRLRRVSNSSMKWNETTADYPKLDSNGSSHPINTKKENNNNDNGIEIKIKKNMNKLLTAQSNLILYQVDLIRSHRSPERVSMF